MKTQIFRVTVTELSEDSIFEFSAYLNGSAIAKIDERGDEFLGLLSKGVRKMVEHNMDPVKMAAAGLTIPTLSESVVYQVGEPELVDIEIDSNGRVLEYPSDDLNLKIFALSP